MNVERDKFLTEAMGECWHEFYSETSMGCLCKNCGIDLKCLDLQHLDFSTWDGFGKLIKFCRTREWWDDFVYENLCIDYSDADPDRFADKLYTYLKENK